MHVWTGSFWVKLTPLRREHYRFVLLEKIEDEKIANAGIWRALISYDMGETYDISSIFRFPLRDVSYMRLD